jgi:hypothetical protein
MAKGEPAARPARELGLSRKQLHTLRRRMQAHLNETATPHVGGRRHVQVRRHGVPECLPWLARPPQCTGETRGRFTCGDAAEQEPQRCRAWTGLRERRTGEKRVGAVTAPTAVGGNMVLRSTQPPIAAPTAGAVQPMRVKMALPPDEADAVL